MCSADWVEAEKLEEATVRVQRSPTSVEHKDAVGRPVDDGTQGFAFLGNRGLRLALAPTDDLSQQQRGEDAHKQAARQHLQAPPEGVEELGLREGDRRDPRCARGTVEDDDALLVVA